MASLQKAAEIYANKHRGSYSASCRDLLPYYHDRFSADPGLHLPPNCLSQDPYDYLFDLNQQFTGELSSGNLSCLDQIRGPGRIAYGSTADRKRFVVLGFDDREHNAVPIRGGDMPVLILADHGTVLQNMPHKQMKESTIGLCGLSFTFRTER